MNRACGFVALPPNAKNEPGRGEDKKKKKEGRGNQKRTLRVGATAQRTTALIMIRCSRSSQTLSATWGGDGSEDGGCEVVAKEWRSSGEDEEEEKARGGGKKIGMRRLCFGVNLPLVKRSPTRSCLLGGEV